MENRGGFSGIALTRSLLIRLRDSSAYSGRPSPTVAQLLSSFLSTDWNREGAVRQGSSEFPPLLLRNPGGALLLKGLQKREKLGLLLARQLAESTNHLTGFPVVAANGLFERQ
jgi:hypothetical protein